MGGFSLPNYTTSRPEFLSIDSLHNFHLAFLVHLTKKISQNLLTFYVGSGILISSKGSKTYDFSEN